MVRALRGLRSSDRRTKRGTLSLNVWRWIMHTLQLMQEETVAMEKGSPSSRCECNVRHVRQTDPDDLATEHDERC